MTPTGYSQPCPAKPKRIVICCDGTWQSATALQDTSRPPSNIAKLCRVLASAGTAVGQDEDGVKEYQQVVYYDAGVGTGKISAIEKAIQGGNGDGLVENVIECFNFIVNNYTQGDKLYFFGFSRGAFTARACAGLVWEVGILRPSSMREFIELYSAYINAGDFDEDFARTEAWTEFRKRKGDRHAIVPSYTQPVEVIGVFDTVGALGVPDLGHLIRVDNSGLREQYQFHDVELNPGVKHAFQALALDERRQPFIPCVWKASKAKNPTLELLQCWFPGVHTNIGGGSSLGKSESSHWEQLASISYAWMLDRIRPYLALDPEELAAQQADWDVMLRPPTAEEAKREQEAQTLLQRVAGWLGKEVADKPGYAAAKITDSHTGVYDLIGLPKDRVPLDLSDEDIANGKFTNECVHFSVGKRQVALGQDGYKPAALTGWQRRDVGKGQYEWVKPASHGTAEKVLPEYELGHVPQDWSLEAWLLERDKGQA